ncbi:unnamed protein product, partial [Sphacelaria rigidula]
MFYTVGVYVEQNGFLPKAGVSVLTLGQLVLETTVGNHRDHHTYVEAVEELFAALRIAYNTRPGATLNGDEDEDGWTPATSNCRGQKKDHRRDDDDTDGGHSRRRHGGGGSSSSSSGPNRPPRKPKGK